MTTSTFTPSPSVMITTRGVNHTHILSPLPHKVYEAATKNDNTNNMTIFSSDTNNNCFKLLTPPRFPASKFRLGLPFRNNKTTTKSSIFPRTLPLTKPNHKIHNINNNVVTLYLIRHGEASHNVLEKAAKAKARAEAEAAGLSPEQVEERGEQARLKVLLDDSLFDASLSEDGRKEAQEASKRLEQIISQHSLPPPQHVLVSPLSRTLETANLIFPEHNDIHVREELRERCTGKPCDQRMPSDVLRSRQSYQRFSMNRLESLDVPDDDENDEGSEQKNYNPSHNGNISRKSPRIDSECSLPEEDKAKLRVRTRKLLDLLGESNQPSVAVVTHKAYLRELERGPFGNPQAKEFGNCEIRVYQVRLGNDAALEHAERLL